MSDLLSIYTSQAEMSNFFTDKVGLINPLSLGAKGDDSTDDTQKLADTLAEIDSTKGGTLYLPPDKIFKISALDIEDKNRLRITGGGKLHISGTNGYGPKLIGTINNLEIDHIEIYGDNDDSLYQTSIGNASGQTISNIKIHHCYIHDLSTGPSLNADLSGTYENAWIMFNRIYNIVGTGAGHGYGLHWAKAKNVKALFNFIDKCQRHSIYQAKGEDTGNLIMGNTIKNHRQGVATEEYRMALSISRSSEVEACHNWFIDCYDGCTIVDHDSLGFDCGNISVHHNHYVNRKNVVPYIVVGEQAVPVTYITDDVEIVDNYFDTDHTSVDGSDVVILNGTKIKFRRNNARKRNIASAQIFVELGHNSYITSDGHCTDNDVDDNTLIAEGDDLSSVRGVYIPPKICVNTSSQKVGPNKFAGCSSDVYYGSAVTNPNIVEEKLEGIIEGTYVAADTTPSVYHKNFMIISNAAGVSITDFDDGVQGQVITLWFTEGNTTLVHNASNIVLSGAVNFTGAAGNVMVLVYKGTVWYEVSRRT